MILTKILRNFSKLFSRKFRFHEKFQESLDMPLYEKKSVVVVIFRDVKNENLEEGKN